MWVMRGDEVLLLLEGREALVSGGSACGGRDQGNKGENCNEAYRGGKENNT